MSDYPSYLIHYGIQGQKWGVRRFQNEDGTYTSEGFERRYTKEGYKSLKSKYKNSIKDARKEFQKVRKESGKNKLLSNKMDQYKAMDKVDDWAIKKSKELYEKYKNVKIYEAKLKGKNNPKLRVQNYFSELGLDPGILGISYPTLNMYNVYSGPDEKIKVRKQSIQYYQS